MRKVIPFLAGKTVSPLPFGSHHSVWALLALMFGLVVTRAGAEGQAGVLKVPADHPDIRYTGRWNLTDSKAPWVVWQGSTVTVRFTGSTATMEIDSAGGAGQFRIVVDGRAEEKPLDVRPGRGRYLLTVGLSDADHTLTMMKETFNGNRTTLLGLEVSGKKPTLLALPPRPALRVEFYGDSNMDGTSLYSERDSGSMGTYFAYPALVTRMLGVEMNLEAHGGATLGGEGSNTVLSFIDSEDWHHQDHGYRSGFAPQVIVVNAGANDISSVKGEGAVDIIKGRYKAVIAKLRERYGQGPHIVLYDAYGWDPNEPANYMHEAVREIGGRLSGLLYPWSWEQWHGSMVEHGGQARILADHIASLGLGFSIRQNCDVFDGFGRGFNVANGSFEDIARGGFSAFGWRYFDHGVERIRDPKGAPDSEHYIRLRSGKSIHQGIDATGDFLPGGTTNRQQYVVRARVRSVEDRGQFALGADFEGQAYRQRGNAQSETFQVNRLWREYRAVFTAPVGAWKTYFILRAASGDMEVDHVRVSSE